MNLNQFFQEVRVNRRLPVVRNQRSNCLDEPELLALLEQGSSDGEYPSSESDLVNLEWALEDILAEDADGDSRVSSTQDPVDQFFNEEFRVVRQRSDRLDEAELQAFLEQANASDEDSSSGYPSEIDSDELNMAMSWVSEDPSGQFSNEVGRPEHANACGEVHNGPKGDDVGSDDAQELTRTQNPEPTDPPPLPANDATLGASSSGLTPSLPLGAMPTFHRRLRSAWHDA